MDTRSLIASAGLCDEILAGLGEVRKANKGRLAEARLATLLTNHFKGRSKSAIKYIVDQLKSGKITNQGELNAALDYIGGMMGKIPANEAREIIAATTILYAAQKGDIAKTMGLKFALHQADQYAINAMGLDQIWHVGDFYNAALSNRIRQITTDIILKEGLSRDEAARKLAGALANEFGIGRGAGYPVQIPTGWKGSVDDYFKMLASTVHDRSANLGRVASFLEAGVKTYRIEAVMDERTSEICRAMDGKEFDIKYVMDWAKRYFEAKDLNEFDDVTRWREASEVKGLDEKDLAKAGMALPPYHGNCRTVVVAVDFYPIGGGSGPVLPPIKPPPPPPKMPASVLPKTPLPPKAPKDTPKTPLTSPDPVGNDLKTSKIKRVKMADDPGCNQTYRITLESGRQGAFKPGDGEHIGLLERLMGPNAKPGSMASREVAASEFDRMTGWGLVPRTIMREIDEMGLKGKGSVQEWILNATAASKMKKHGRSLIAALNKGPRGQQMEFMDLILANGDRHKNNFIFDPTDNVWAIDNGLCCPTKGLVGGNAYEWRMSRISSTYDTDDSIIQFIEATNPNQIKDVLLKAGVDEYAARRAASRFAYVKDHIGWLRVHKWHKAYEHFTKAFLDEDML